MRTETREFKEFDLIKIDSLSGLSVTFIDYGASIYEIVYKGAIMTATPVDMDYMLHDKSCYFGKTIGRINGRIGEHRLRHEEFDMVLEANEGINTLHGGNNSLSNHRFKYEVEIKDGVCRLTFTYVSPNGEGGFLGELTSRVVYILSDDSNALRIEHHLESDVPTLAALTNHVYFNLGGSDTIDDYVLQIASGTICDVDPDDLVPHGKKKAPENLDFRKGLRIGDHINDPSLVDARAHGYDHPFVLDEAKDGEPVAVLKGNGYRMDVFTDYGAAVFYSDNYPVEGLTFTNGIVDHLHASMPFECCVVPEDYEAMRINPGKTVSHFIEYRFSEED